LFEGLRAAAAAAALQCGVRNKQRNGFAPVFSETGLRFACVSALGGLVRLGLPFFGTSLPRVVFKLLKAISVLFAEVSLFKKPRPSPLIIEVLFTGVFPRFWYHRLDFEISSKFARGLKTCTKQNTVLIIDSHPLRIPSFPFVRL
jgi:hypothetical protein